MLSFYEIRYQGNGKYAQGACLSTDAKPTSGILNGSSLIEMDTGKVFFYDAAGRRGREFGGSGT